MQRIKKGDRPKWQVACIHCMDEWAYDSLDVTGIGKLAVVRCETCQYPAFVGFPDQRTPYTPVPPPPPPSTCRSKQSA